MNLEAMVKFAAMIGYVSLAQLAIDEAREAGTITQEEADRLSEQAAEINRRFA